MKTDIKLVDTSIFKSKLSIYQKKKNQNYLYAWPKLFSKVKKSIYFAIKIYGGSDFVVLP